MRSGKTSGVGPGRSVRVLASAVATLAIVFAPAAQSAGAATSAPAVSPRPDLQRSLDAIVAAGALGVQAEVIDRQGVWRGVSGSARLDKRQPVTQQGLFRIGSTTKTFTATVLLQLVAEKRVGLDDPIERYLPRLVPNGKNITVRQLLNHTSGLREYLQDTEAIPMSGVDFLTKVRFTSFTGEQLVSHSTKYAPDSPPGTRWSYSNTNYVLAGLIIAKVTGHSYEEEVQRRILEPLGLWNTYVPGTRTSIRGSHAHGYMRVTQNGQTRSVDITRLNPSWAGAAGEMISTTGDLNRFFAALLDGRLLPPAQLAAMKTTVPMGTGSSDGLGIVEWPLSCGTKVWGKDGTIQGFETQSLHSSDGRRHISISVNTPEFLGANQQKIWAAIQKSAATAFCDAPGQ
ncbi:serine hydrolase domain-containing protein [Nonomuraea sp. NPDC000554]|uniref:serine hydrolase domain-containing protein n=1 Tax=Nonomuraea sp. NPDC000554 TaxID=3154259 RepID=UPI0033259205